MNSRTNYLISTLLFINISLAQNIPNSITFFDLKSKIKEYKRAAVSIETIPESADFLKTNTLLLGSGFLTLKSGMIYIVTNHHVVSNIPNTNLLLVGVNIVQGKIYLIAKVIKSDPVKDIAVLISTKEHLARFKAPSDLKLDQSAVGISLYSSLDEIEEGESALVVGYPLGIGSEITQNKPVSRIGIIAQSISSNGTFLLDAIASHGNSGSPVFNLQNGKLMGMIFAHHNDFIQAFDDNKQLIANFPYNSGITLCISAQEILKMLP